ncbi:hypothetical protein [Absidia glauca]|uniref:DUF4939 domain-containing protein n=1 Tax=Absidia glauca TaxID=4829 RepID=A0A168MI66_ABSGL|nr:hypothetical protein [Absidia glauca]
MDTTENEIQLLSQQLQELREHMYHQEHQREDHPESKVVDPEYFHGDRCFAKNFMFQLQLVFASQTRRYAADSSKVAYAGSRLRGVAFTWFSTHLQRNDANILQNYGNFCQEFNR